MAVFVRFDVGWAYRNWGDKGVIVRGCGGQVWCSGPRDLGVSMGSGVCVAGDHLRHGAEFFVFGSVFILLRAVRTHAGLVTRIATDVRNGVGLVRTRVSGGE